MCGIFCCYNREGDLAAYRPRAIACSKKQRHRGPDWSGCYMAKDSLLVHERLAIVGVGEFIGPGVQSVSPCAMLLT
jgi:asparagine synthase (glutamine-hydrolysing)